MRKALSLLVLLSACAAPAGASVETCDGSWRGVESRIVVPGGAEPRQIPIECIRVVDERRIRIGFTMPQGPACHRIEAIEVVEGADAVSVILSIARDETPAAGACPEEEQRTATEVDLQAPVAERSLLDGSRGD